MRDPLILIHLSYFTQQVSPLSFKVRIDSKVNQTTKIIFQLPILWNRNWRNSGSKIRIKFYQIKEEMKKLSIQSENGVQPNQKLKKKYKEEKSIKSQAQISKQELS